MSKLGQVKRHIWRLGAVAALPLAGVLAAPSASASVHLRPAASVSRATIPATGGTVVVRSRLVGAHECGFTVVPKIDGFDGRLHCDGGTFRVLRVSANATSAAITYRVRVALFSTAGNAARALTVTESAAPPKVAPKPKPKPKKVVVKKVAPKPKPKAKPVVKKVAPKKKPTTPKPVTKVGITYNPAPTTTTTTTVPPSTIPAPTTTYYVAPTYTPAPVTTPPPTTTTPPTTVRATIDPSYVVAATTPQNPPVAVTFTFSASAGTTSTGAQNPLPDGTLNLTIYVPNSVSVAGGCQANVGAGLSPSGDPTDPVSCTITVPAWGSYDLIVTYSGGGQVSATGETSTVDVQPPSPPTVTNDFVWGLNAPSSQPTASIVVHGSTATIDATDNNWENPSGPVIFHDGIGDSCSLAISGTNGTCTITLSTPGTTAGQLSTPTINWPGSTSTTTQTIDQWGVTQQQPVDNVWAPDAAQVVNPTVTIEQANIAWNGGYSATWASQTGAPPNPLVTVAGDRVELDALVTGNMPGDSLPSGSIDMTITSTPGSASYTTYNQSGVGGTNCADISATNGVAVGGCEFTFDGPGTYTVIASYVSTDPNYSSITNALSETIDVTS